MLTSRSAHSVSSGGSVARCSGRAARSGRAMGGFLGFRGWSRWRAHCTFCHALRAFVPFPPFLPSLRAALVPAPHPLRYRSAPSPLQRALHTAPHAPRLGRGPEAAPKPPRCRGARASEPRRSRAAVRAGRGRAVQRPHGGQDPPQTRHTRSCYPAWIACQTFLPRTKKEALSVSEKAP